MMGKLSDRLSALAEKATKGPWAVGYRALSVEAEDHKGTMKIYDVRGWGHLTGQGIGALGLPADEAEAIQAANAQLTVELVNALPTIISALQEKDL